MSSVLAAAARVCEVVVVDLPRSVGEPAQIALAASDLVLMVVPAEIRAVAAAARVATEVMRFADDVQIVVRGPAPGGLDAADIANSLGLPLAGKLKAEPALAVALERGEVPAGPRPWATRGVLPAASRVTHLCRRKVAVSHWRSVFGRCRRPLWISNPGRAGDSVRVARGTVDAALVARVRGRLAAEAVAPTAARVAALVREEAGVRGAAQVLAAVETLRSELLGAGPLEALLHEPGVTDVLVNGPREVWVDRGHGLERADAHFTDDREIRRLAVRLAAAAGRRLDDAVPCADIRLADGVRLHAVLPPVSPGGACLSFRVPRQRAFSLDELVDLGAMPVAAARLLGGVIASRASFVVTGGTGTGKTTFAVDAARLRRSAGAHRARRGIPGSCDPTIHTWCVSKRARRTSKASVRSSCVR